MLKQFASACLAALFLVFAGLGVQADERILSFASDIDVDSNGTLTVTETIRVRAEGAQIKRGIFRDIPLTAEGANGRVYRVGFELLSVLQDGQPAPNFARQNGAGIRIYIGEESVFLQPGVYTYTIKYRTDRQVRFFDDHDEVYWNVTGNEWNFPIDEAVARVRLPEGVKATEWSAYTGPFGATGQNYTAKAENGGSEVVFATTHPLSVREGLTVVVSMPVGAVSRPSSAQQMQYFLSDYRSELIGGGGLLLVALYYLFAWFKVGRDPAKGVIFPRFKPPARISPALSRYIVNRGFGDGGWVALSAACLNLAVKRRLRLEDNDGDMMLTLDREGREDHVPGFGLPKGEAALETWLMARGSPLTLNKANGMSIKSLGSRFTGAIEQENRNVFFKSNWTYLPAGVLMSLATLVALFFLVPTSKGEQEFMILFLFLSVFATVFPTAFGLAFIPIGNLKLRIGVVFAVVGLAMFGAAQLAGLATGGLETLPAVPVIVVGLVAANLLAFMFIGAPTALGREAMDEIEGLKLYLSVAEKDRLNMTEAPDMSTQHFEELLPYAVALDVEKPWAKAFEGWLATAAGAAAAASYHPNWYSNRSFDARHVSDSLGKTASAMAGSFQSSVPIPKSSSSGSSGGGSSGGGGGGGGGGGW
ncbi:DUF2207 domain-containing protein [Roseibium sp. Sym1]|uniref:DUF2207 domain-containing protein n=1 Tax=Roseibium sp. Sym1 TaxID=3016006 RepID=UPI0022B3D4C9|nr:DUF2207 domain-containing protein [Roseibium sp. Sym1]